MDLETACALLTGRHSIARIDGMDVEGRHYYLRAGTGLDALVIQGTKPEVKRRLEWIAYCRTAIKQLGGFQPRYFHIFVDREATRTRAPEVAVVNCGTMSRKPLRWGPGMRPDDGKIHA